MLRIEPSAFDTRLCRIGGCDNELERDAPARGRHANMCGPCRNGDTMASRLYFEKLPGGRRFEAPVDDTPPPGPRERQPSRHEEGDPLTNREEHVLFAIADGLEDSEIARELGLSRDTIKTYVKALLRKMGARNRTHAVALAYHRGLLLARAQTG